MSPQEFQTKALTDDLGARMRSNGFVTCQEAQLENGQRVDLVALQRKLRPTPAILFEIKVSRADLMADLRAEKWRGYLPYGAVAFAMPFRLAKAQEVPPEAGVIFRHADGWRWARKPREWSAIKASDYLLRRILLTALDETEERERLANRPTLVSMWEKAAADRDARRRRMFQIAWDQEAAEAAVARLRDDVTVLMAEKAALQEMVRRLKTEARPLAQDRVDRVAVDPWRTRP